MGTNDPNMSVPSVTLVGFLQQMTEGGSMLSVMKAIPEAIKGWTENREQLYSFVACAAAVLVLTAFLNGMRPTDSLAVLAQAFGMTPVANWLSIFAPPLVSARVEIVNEAALAAALLLFMGMIVVPLRRGRHSTNQRFTEEFIPLIGAPAAATIWMLLAVAAQHGDINAPLHRLARTVSIVGWWVLGALLVGMILYFLARRYGLDSPVRLLLRILEIAPIEGRP